MNECMVTLGCIMAAVIEHDSGEITSATAGNVRLTYCPTTESSDNRIITTPEMLALGEAGFLPIAIARLTRDDPSQFVLLAASGLSEELRLALEHRGCDLVMTGLSGLADELDGPKVLH
jgi:hypothetical protein